MQSGESLNPIGQAMQRFVDSKIREEGFPD